MHHLLGELRVRGVYSEEKAENENVENSNRTNSAIDPRPRTSGLN
jgi:hypothetical protein